MRSYTPAIVTCLVGVVLMVGAALAWAASPPARGGEAVAPAVIVVPHLHHALVRVPIASSVPIVGASAPMAGFGSAPPG